MLVYQRVVNFHTRLIAAYSTWAPALFTLGLMSWLPPGLRVGKPWICRWNLAMDTICHHSTGLVDTGYGLLDWTFWIFSGAPRLNWTSPWSSQPEWRPGVAWRSEPWRAPILCIFWGMQIRKKSIENGRTWMNKIWQNCASFVFVFKNYLNIYLNVRIVIVRMCYPLLSYIYCEEMPAFSHWCQVVAVSHHLHYMLPETAGSNHSRPRGKVPSVSHMTGLTVTSWSACCGIHEWDRNQGKQNRQARQWTTWTRTSERCMCTA